MHDGQYRKNSGKPYISHPIAVDATLEDQEHIKVALLHDTIEDTSLTLQDLVEHHHLSMNMVYAIASLTRSPTQTYLDYILQVNDTKLSRDVKIADLMHNLSDLEDGCLKDKYLMALYILES